MGLGVQIREDRRLDVTFSEALLGWTLGIDDEHGAEEGVEVVPGLGRLIVDEEGRGLLVLVGWLTAVVRLIGHRLGISIIEGRIRESERGVLELLARGCRGHDAETRVAREAIVAGQVERPLLLANDPVRWLWAHERAQRFPGRQGRELPSIWLLLVVLHKQQLCQLN